MKKVKVTIADKSTETLKTELGALESQYNDHKVTFKNSKGAENALPYNRIDRLGAFVGDRESEKATFDVYLACVFRAQHEAKKQAELGASVVAKAGHSMKAGSTSLGFRTSKMDSRKTEVVAQLAHAQKLAKGIHEIRQELEKRAEAEKVAAAAAALVAKQAEEAAALMGLPAPAPVAAPVGWTQIEAGAELAVA